MTDIPILTIDGPSGSGKGTIAQMVAKDLDWHYLDSGALYRVLAQAANQHEVALDNVTELVALAETLALRFVTEKENLKVLLAGQDVSGLIRSEQIGNAASKIAALPAVRQALLARQRGFKQLPGLVTDGRDMGTVVFPEAKYKVYLSASAEERAKRRYKQLKQKGIESNICNLIKEISERDLRDSQRQVAPLKPAENAIIIDSSDMTAIQVFERVKAIYT